MACEGDTGIFFHHVEKSTVSPGAEWATQIRAADLFEPHPYFCCSQGRCPVLSDGVIDDNSSVRKTNARDGKAEPHNSILLL